MINKVKSKIRQFLAYDDFYYLNRYLIELNNQNELKKVFRWGNDPIISDNSMYDFLYIEDVNERRIRDAETIGTVSCNVNNGVFLEIGTSRGHSTALIAKNAPSGKIYTVNIDPEEAMSGKGGILITEALNREDIGSFYKEKGFKNIKQIFTNTATWKPDVGTVDVAFIDGCHDTEFVYRDTVKVIKHMKKGSIIMWHDFNLDLTKKFHWINSVCLGIEKLYRDGIIKGRIYHIRDSWVGIYQIA
jgi:hypothetical protein